MGKRRRLEQQQQQQQEEGEGEGEESKQVDEPRQLDWEEEAIKADKKKRKKEKKEKRRAEGEQSDERREETKEQPAEADQDEQVEEVGASEKRKRKSKRVKQEAQDDSEPANNGAEMESKEAYEHGSAAVKSEESADDHFDLASLRRANSPTPRTHKSTLSSSSSTSSTSSPPAVPSSTRIFIGNLPFKITDDLLHSTFSPCGTIEGVHWVTDKTTGKFYGSAFIDFQSPAALQPALQLNNTELLGRPIKVGVATGRQAAGQNRFNCKQKNGGHLALHPISDKPDGTTTVFLGNLSFDIDEDTVRQLFAECGEVTQVRWVEKDGVFKGCGFVEFDATEATDLAVKFNGRELLGRPMRVDYSGNTNRGE